MSRPSWSQHWLSQARLAAEMSTCASGRKVGAVAVKGNRLLASGFNGVPSKTPHPMVCIRRIEGIPSGVDPHRCGCKHAEASLVATAARFGIPLAGATVYVTTRPCRACTGMLVDAGIVRVVFDGDYPDDESLRFFEFAQVELTRIEQCRD